MSEARGAGERDFYSRGEEMKRVEGIEMGA
jgi:hypothetical protein